MSTFKPCNFTDCPAHPDYIESKKEIEEGDLYIDQNDMRVWISTGNHTHTMPLKVETSSGTNSWTNWSSNSSVSYQSIDTSKITDSTMKFNIANVSVSVECLMCKHFKKCDMRELLIVQKAKEELEK